MTKARQIEAPELRQGTSGICSIALPVAVGRKYSCKVGEWRRVQGIDPVS